MGRQRRGVLGCTNLPSLTHNCEARAHSHHLTRQPPSSRDTRGVLQDAKAAGRVEATSCDNDPEMDRRLRLKPMRRDKFKLPLISSGSTGGTATRAGQCRTKRKLSPREALLAEHEKAKVRCAICVCLARSAEQLTASCWCSSFQQVLVEAIEAHETASKSFKNEHWYASPIGFGSRKSVLLAALKSRDPGGSGLLTAKQLVEALRAPNFGLDEQQARSLLSHFDAQLVKEDAKVPYRAFVKHLRLPEERPNQPGQDPTMFYQESYINRVRMHAAKLIEKAAAVDLAAVLGSPRDSLSSALPPLTTSGPRRDATGPQNNGKIRWERP
jgi:hypothetical protein